MKKSIYFALMCTLQFSLCAQTQQLILNSPNANYPGHFNTVYGDKAGNPNADQGSQMNLIMGYQAGISFTTGERNTLLGYAAGKGLTSGNSNILIGKSAGSHIGSGSNNIILGEASCPDCRDNTIIGWNSGKAIRVEGSVMIGTGSFTTQTTAWGGNVIIGYMAAGSQADHLQNSVIIGQSAGSRTKGNGIMIGSGAGRVNMGKEIIFIGQNAGDKNIRDGNMFIGNLSGERADATESLFIGNRAVRPDDMGIDSKCQECTFIGHKSGQYDIESIGSTYLGYQAGLNFSKGTGNTFIGKHAGYGPAQLDHQLGGGQGSHNTVVGQDAGKRMKNASDNLFLGSMAGEQLEQGTGNIFIGKNSGSTLKGPVNNLMLIGANCSAGIGVENAIAIGSNLALIKSNTLILGIDMNVGIGVNAPGNKLEIQAVAQHSSGLRFSNLTASSEVVSSNNLALSVDEHGDVVLTSLPTDLDQLLKEINLLADRCTALKDQDNLLKSELANANALITGLNTRVEILESFHKCRLKKKKGG